MKPWEWLIVFVIVASVLYLYYEREQTIMELRAQIQQISWENSQLRTHLKHRNNLVAQYKREISKYKEEIQKQKEFTEPFIQRDIDNIYDALKEKNPALFGDSEKVKRLLEAEVRDRLQREARRATPSGIVDAMIRWFVRVIIISLIFLILWLIINSLGKVGNGLERAILSTGVVGLILGYLLFVTTAGSISSLIYIASTIDNPGLFMIANGFLPVIVGGFAAHLLIHYIDPDSFSTSKPFIVIITLLLCVITDLLVGTEGFRTEPYAFFAKGAFVTGLLLWAFFQYPYGVSSRSCGPPPENPPELSGGEGGPPPQGQIGPGPDGGGDNPPGDPVVDESIGGTSDEKPGESGSDKPDEPPKDGGGASEKPEADKPPEEKPDEKPGESGSDKPDEPPKDGGGASEKPEADKPPEEKPDEKPGESGSDKPGEPPKDGGGASEKPGESGSDKPGEPPKDGGGQSDKPEDEKPPEDKPPEGKSDDKPRNPGAAS